MDLRIEKEVSNVRNETENEDKKEEDNKAPIELKKHGIDLTIKKLKTNKDLIKVRPLMEQKIIPSHPEILLINGRAGSGKSMLVLNLLTRPEFYGKNETGQPYFDMIHIFSPTLEQDDLYDEILEKYPKGKVKFHPIIKEEELEQVIKEQESQIKKKRLNNSKKVLLLFDDIISQVKFVKSNTFMSVVVANRHKNFSVWILTQSYTKIPRTIRLNANHLMVFPMSFSELQLIRENYQPSGLSRREFEELIRLATGERFSFLYINLKDEPSKRFRKNLETMLVYN